MANWAITRALLLAGVSLGAIGLGTTGAYAGGFFLHEQSTYFQGTSFAGAAAGGPALSAMFWNPATVTQQNRGLASEINATAIFPKTEIVPRQALTAFGDLTALGGAGDISTDAFVPASYYTYGWNDWLTLGFGLNAPFGLNTKAGPVWAGMFYGTESDVFTLNANPVVGIRVNDWLSIGVGAQVQYFKVKLHSLFPGSGSVPPFGPLVPDQLRIDGDSWDFGFTAGLTLTPWAGTVIGFGYRSRIDHDIEGDIFRPAFLLPVPPAILAVPTAFVNFEATVPLPDIATVSIRQKIGEAFTLMATVEWQNWSRLGTIPVTISAPGLAPGAVVPGVPNALAFEWRDGWLFSVGGEYQWRPNLAIRAGVAYERSPIDDTTRSVRLPDNDRVWLSAGASYQWSDRLAVELGYSHIFAAKDTTINIVPGNPTFNPALGTFIGDVNTQADIISLGLRYRFLPAAPAPVVTKG